MWMVRAGRGGARAQQFIAEGFIAIGFDVPDLSLCKSKDDVERLVQTARPGIREGALSNTVGQLARFTLDFTAGVRIATYDGQTRLYHLGQIVGAYEFRPDGTTLRHRRRVSWAGQVERDSLTTGARNTLGSALTIFEVPQDVIEELDALAAGRSKAEQETTTADRVKAAEPALQDIDLLRRDSEERARAFIVDRVIRLDWQELQELVAGILRGMGFKTRVAREGPDRGCDILASPDGLGLSQPRIIVEAKHRPRNQIDAPLIRSFLGARRPGDNGMYVSTGGFSKEARYEADRANIPLKLIDLEELVDLLIENYPEVDAETRALVPLVPVFWPVNA